MRVLNEFYQRCGAYYSSEGWTNSVNQTNTGEGTSESMSTDNGSKVGTSSSGDESSASELERSITAHLFTMIFENLSRQPYEPELFSYALPCLCAIACALPPDYLIDLAEPNGGVVGSNEVEGFHNNQMGNFFYFLVFFWVHYKSNLCFFLKVRIFFKFKLSFEI